MAEPANFTNVYQYAGAGVQFVVDFADGVLTAEAQADTREQIRRLAVDIGFNCAMVYHVEFTRMLVK